MDERKQIGIWMDHAVAHVIVPANRNSFQNTLNSEFTQQVKEDSIGKSEHVMHNKEQHQQAKFYKQISEVLGNYNEVLLFGPSTAKDELHNLLKANHQFAKTRIEVLQADKMTEPQQLAFVRKHFLLE